MFRILLPTTLALSLIAAAGDAEAAYLGIDSLSPDGSTTISWEGFDRFNVGSVNGGDRSREGSADIAFGERGTFTGYYFNSNSSIPTPPKRTLYFVDQAGSNSITDIFTFEFSLSGTITTLIATFISGDGLGSVPVDVDPSDVLAGGTFSYLNDFFTGETIVPTVTAAVPLPAGILLLASALAGFGFFRRPAVTAA